MMNGQAEHGKKDIRHFRDLDVCKLAFAVAMKVYEITKAFPEIYNNSETLVEVHQKFPIDTGHKKVI